MALYTFTAESKLQLLHIKHNLKHSNQLKVCEVSPILWGQMENTEVRKPKYGNGSTETEVRKRKYGNRSTETEVRKPKYGNRSTETEVRKLKYGN